MEREIRAFIALEPSEAQRQVLQNIQNTLKEHRADIAWTKPSNIHLTLKFLGDMSSARIPDVTRAIHLAAGAIPPFPFQLTRCGAFPDLQNPKVLWAGAADPDGQLSRLAALLEEHLAPVGFPKESHGFTAHLTLGRVRSLKNIAPLTQAISLVPVPDQRQNVTEIVLFRSTLTPEGSVYEEISKAPLGATA